MAATEAKVGHASLMPEECYADPNYKWEYSDDEGD